MIRIVRGNRFRLLIPLELTTTDGGVSKTEKYTPTEQCRVCVRKASASYDVPHSVQDTNVLVVDIAAGLLGNGTYAVEVPDKDVRSMRLAQFAIVETTEEADIKQPTDFELQTAVGNIKTELDAIAVKVDSLLAQRGTWHTATERHEESGI